MQFGNYTSQKVDDDDKDDKYEVSFPNGYAALLLRSANDSQSWTVGVLAKGFLTEIESIQSYTPLSETEVIAELQKIEALPEPPAPAPEVVQSLSNDDAMRQLVRSCYSRLHILLEHFRDNGTWKVLENVFGRNWMEQSKVDLVMLVVMLEHRLDDTKPGVGKQ